MREAHLGVPAARSAAGTKIIYYDIKRVFLLLSQLAAIHYIDMSRKIREIHYTSWCIGNWISLYKKIKRDFKAIPLS
jgi:hypothetical protein